MIYRYVNISSKKFIYLRICLMLGIISFHILFAFLIGKANIIFKIFSFLIYFFFMDVFIFVDDLKFMYEDLQKYIKIEEKEGINAKTK